MTTPTKIIQLLAARSALGLEMRTKLRHSKLDLRKVWARHFDMPAHSTREQIIRRIEQELDSVGYRK